MSMPMPAGKPVPAKKPAPARKGAGKPKPRAAPVMDHSTMTMPMPAGDAAMQGQDAPMPADMPMPMAPAAMPGMDMPPGAVAPTAPITPIPVLTDADRAAAAPPSDGMAVHDNSIQSYLLFDRLETWKADPGAGLAWEGEGWIGTDRNRLWLRSEGEGGNGRIENADLEVLYGRSVARWWDVVAGVRQDFGAGPSQTFAAIGVLGLAPYKYELEATAYFSPSGQTAARVEATYDTLFTNRLILQWQAEANLYGQGDARRGVGAGLATIEAGLRLRYEFTRQFAPYIGIVRERAFGATAELRGNAGKDSNDTRIVAGLRLWF